MSLEMKVWPKLSKRTEEDECNLGIIKSSVLFLDSIFAKTDLAKMLKCVWGKKSWHAPHNWKAFGRSKGEVMGEEWISVGDVNVNRFMEKSMSGLETISRVQFG